MKFPHTIKSGSAQVKIYRTPVVSKGKKYEAFTVRYYFDNKPQQKKFGKFTDAEAHATDALRRINNGTIGVMAMTNADQSAYLRAKELLTGTGKAVEIAVAEYMESVKALNGVPVTEAARYYALQHPFGLIKKTVREVYLELLEFKKQDGASEAWRKDLRLRLGKFCERFGELLLIELSGPAIEDWLRSLNLSGRSRNNYRICISALISFGKKRKYLPREFSELDSITIAKEESGDVVIFTPDEMRKLLTASKNGIRLWLAFGGFAGMRTSEISRLDWSLVKKDWIEVKATMARKTGARRLVPILPALKKWTSKDRESEGPVWNYSSEEIPSETLIKLETDSGIAWKKNALRHSFISYRLAAIKNTAQVAMECGTSERKIFSNYRELVSEKEAAKWFSIFPR